MQKISSGADGGGTYNESEAVAAAIGAVGNAELEGEVESVVNKLHIAVPHGVCRLEFFPCQIEKTATHGERSSERGRTGGIGQQKEKLAVNRLWDGEVEGEVSMAHSE